MKVHDHLQILGENLPAPLQQDLVDLLELRRVGLQEGARVDGEADMIEAALAESAQQVHIDIEMIGGERRPSVALPIAGLDIGPVHHRVDRAAPAQAWCGRIRRARCRHAGKDQRQRGQSRRSGGGGQ